MLGLVKGSFSISKESTIVVAMIQDGEVGKGDSVTFILNDGTSRTLVVKAVETIAPNDPNSPQRYPIALIVDPLPPGEPAVGGTILSSLPATSGPGEHPYPKAASGPYRMIS